MWRLGHFDAVVPRIFLDLNSPPCFRIANYTILKSQCHVVLNLRQECKAISQKDDMMQPQSIPDKGPPEFPVTGMLERRSISNNPWTDESWRALGVMINSRLDHQVKHVERVISETDHDQFLWSGLTLRLYMDESESYYHNLMSEQPLIFVICRPNEVTHIPEPFLVTASYDEANAYQESDEEVYPVSMAPEIYRWLEEFVLRNYMPEKRYKRKRKT